MRTLTIGLGILMASCTFALADCEPLKSYSDDIVAYLCDVPAAAKAAPRCHYFDSDRLLCTGEIGQPVSRERVMPGNCKWVRGKLVCKDRG